MQIFENPDRKDWPQLLQRPVLNAAKLEKKVKKILAEVKKDGDDAVRKITADIDKVKMNELLVAPSEMVEATGLLSDELKTAIAIAKHNIETFHQAPAAHTDIIETIPGISCWRKQVAIEKVGLYIPGGSAPLFSTVLMLGVPAAIAGCNEIILATPPQKDGSVHPAILYAAQLAGITKIYKAGGAQAIGAMAYGTESIPSVYKIFGPGNQFVTAAKMRVQQEGVAIDMPAGPSEVCVLADDSADVSFVAADLLSQAEHGPDSQVLLVTTEKSIAEKIETAIKKQLKKLPRQKIARQALKNSKLIVVKDKQEAIDLVNEYAPEHLIICCRDEKFLSDKVINAGSVFLGNYSPEAVGDYASGTNHALPTNGFAKAYSGVNVNSFLKTITFQQLSQEGLMNIARTVEIMAEAEGLTAHANAVRVRLSK